MKTLPSLTQKVRRVFGYACVAALPVLSLHAADRARTIVWHSEQQLMDADIDNQPLSVVVDEFRKATGGEIHVPPGVSKTVSVKFAGLTMGQALPRFFGSLNYYAERQSPTLHIHLLDPNAPSSAPSTTTVATVPRLPSIPKPASAIVQKPADPRFGSGKSRKGPGNGAVTGADTERMVIDTILRESGMVPKDRASDSSNGRSSKSRSSSSGRSKRN